MNKFGKLAAVSALSVMTLTTMGQVMAVSVAEEPQVQLLQANAVDASDAGAKETEVKVKVTGKSVTIEAPSNFDLGAFTASDEDVTVEKQFSEEQEEYFQVNDLLGDDEGFYVTLQATSLVHATAEGVEIPAENIYIKVNNRDITTIAGTENPDLLLGESITTDYFTLANPITLFQRKTGENFGRIGKYGIIPWLSVTIPAFTNPGELYGKINMTLL